MRLRNKPWAKEKLEQYPQVVIQRPEGLKGSWAASFFPDAPVHVEIGTGKGQFLCGMAQKHPDVLFVGIERMQSVIVSALDKTLETDAGNIKLVNRNAADLESFFDESEVERIYLNFSDPWPKNRHEKRRLTYRTFLEKFERVLTAKGEIHLKTDNAGFFEYSLQSMEQYGMNLLSVDWDVHENDVGDNVMTEYEEKFSRRGQKIMRGIARF
ncbi:MAG TPA: tRNA (guanosine(46)-N7)-methyltransferase TrmB [Bacillales bacterium]|nr:tRNA (guanosine(46)-N7)-methyltransferase TrmB [Bacillales bacterium]